MSQINKWKPAVKRLNSDERERLKTGKKLLRQKKYEEAILEFKAVLDSNPQSVNALLGIGLIHFKQEHFDQALSFFGQAKSLDPLKSKPYLLEGFVLLRQGDTGNAEQAFRSALSLDPHSHRVLLGLSSILIDQQRYDEALAQLREALRHNPQLTTPRLLIAKIWTQQDKTDEAITEIRTALEIDPKQAKAYLQLARLYEARGNRESAVEVLDMALAKLPKESSSIFLKLGRFAIDIKCFEVAEKICSEIIALNPKRTVARIFLVEVLIGAGKLEEAENQIKNLPLRNKFAALIHKLLGDVYYQRGQFRIAVEEYRATLLGIPELADELKALDEEIEEGQVDDDWESVADFYQPTLANAVTDQTERLRARRRDQR